MTLTIQKPLTDETLKQAIAIRCASCFTAMRLANQFGGGHSDTWETIYQYSLIDLIEEAEKRKFPLDIMYTMESSSVKIIASKAYQMAVETRERVANAIRTA